MNFDGKVILITGASSGIGAHISPHLAKLGGKVAIVGRNEKRLNDVADEIKKSGSPTPLPIVADITKDTQRIINETIKHFGKLDVLVNNAGILKHDSIEHFDIGVFENIFNTNVKSVLILTNLAVPFLEKTKGNIVNVSSVAGLRPVKELLSYCISKAALDQFTQCTALDLAARHIRVNSVNPAFVKTPILQTVGVPEDQMEQVIEGFKAKYPRK